MDFEQEMSKRIDTTCRNGERYLVQPVRSLLHREYKLSGRLVKAGQTEKCVTDASKRLVLNMSIKRVKFWIM